MKIELKNLVVGYSKDHVLIDEINFNFSQSDFCGLIGPNGSGKTTLFKTLLGMLAPISGSIKINEKEISTISSNEKAKLIGVVTTEKLSNFSMTVYDVLLLGRYPYLRSINYSEKDIGVVTDVLDKLSLKHISNKKMGLLSDGQKQKVMIARALVQESKFIILDEPFTYLDIGQKEWLFNFLKTYSIEKNIGIIFSSHDRFILEKLETSFAITNNKKLIKLKSEEIKSYLEDIKSHSVLF